jgi:hypothetical protein
MIEGEIIHLREVSPGGLWIVGREQIRRHAPRTIALDDAVDGHIPDSKLCNIHLDSPFISFGRIQPFVSPVELPKRCQVRRLAHAQHSGIGGEPTLCIRYAYDTGAGSDPTKL